MTTHCHQEYLDGQPDADREAEMQADNDAQVAYHDATLFALLSAADDLMKLGYTGAELARLVERHLTPETVPFADGTDPIPMDGGRAA